MWIDNIKICNNTIYSYIYIYSASLYNSEIKKMIPQVMAFFLWVSTNLFPASLCRRSYLDVSLAGPSVLENSINFGILVTQTLFLFCFCFPCLKQLHFQNVLFAFWESNFSLGKHLSVSWLLDFVNFSFLCHLSFQSRGLFFN